MGSVKRLEETTQIVSNIKAAENLYFIDVHSPQIAQALRPGQFIHMQIPGMPDKILRRPFSVYKTDAEAGTLCVLYQVVGAGTEHLSTLNAGERCSLIGPIGNAWAPPAGARCLLVGGGVGAAPLFMLAQELAQAAHGVHVVLGAQTKDALVALADYEALPHTTLSAATDDGSFGYAGFCTQPAQDAIDSGEYDYVAVCGPEPLIKIVSGLAQDAGLPCEVSLERRMACGIGACLSCVVDTVEGKKRCCVDGPIFKASEVVW
ncbi:MAG: dihydroorotate dehydrogenase electron transfer subunit [Eggerthellaceae bacterium]|nr:dihydroorotate dehydrogenase electron transfer subunit [Eggerthellaceae bacterium]